MAYNLPLNGTSYMGLLGMYEITKAKIMILIIKFVHSRYFKENYDMTQVHQSLPKVGWNTLKKNFDMTQIIICQTMEWNTRNKYCHH